MEMDGLGERGTEEHSGWVPISPRPEEGGLEGRRVGVWYSMAWKVSRRWVYQNEEAISRVVPRASEEKIFVVGAAGEGGRPA